LYPISVRRATPSQHVPSIFACSAGRSERDYEATAGIYSVTFPATSLRLLVKSHGVSLISISYALHHIRSHSND
jgi:hypothetical protein